LVNPAAHFDASKNYVWPLATTTTGITGFDSGKFEFDTTEFQNDTAGGLFTVSESKDGLSVDLIFSHNPGLVVNPAVYSRSAGTAYNIPIADLLTHAKTSDGNPVALYSVGTSTNGSTIATNKNFVRFLPVNDLPESFPYVVKAVGDYAGVVWTATNYITVNVTGSVAAPQSVSAVGGVVIINFAGIPGYTYVVERSTTLVKPVWEVVQTIKAPANGLWQFKDTTPPSPTAYYRLRQGN
jgi:hypothetical protein